MDESYRIEVGKRLAEARIAAGFMTAADAAKRYRWHPQNVRDHEAGRRGVDPLQADEYARRYNILVEWLLFGRGPMRSTDDSLSAILRKLDPEEVREVLAFARFKVASHKT
jgi:hypothetical protein